MSKSGGFFRIHKRTIAALLFGLTISATLAYAVPPGTQYDPGDTLDPSCIPGSSNCTVDIGGPTVWGDITGTLSDQTDLQTALDGKFDDPTGTTIQYIRGDGSVATIPMVYVDNSYVGQTSGPSADGSSGGGGRNVFIGDDAGSGSGTVNNVVFLGRFAGSGGTNAIYSNFIGHNAGYSATDSYNANFIGRNAGNLASNAPFSVFIGQNAGQYATNASASVFVGIDAGNGATNAINSFFAGKGAGQYAATPSVAGSENAANAIFIGTNAGYTAGDATLDNTTAFDDVSTFANTSILVGHNTSTGGFSNSIALGAYAANTAANQFVIGSTNRKITSVFIGDSKGTASSTNTVFIGDTAGTNATSAIHSNFIGYQAGTTATNAAGSNFLGSQAGLSATNASNSNFLGGSAGASATNASHSNFIGTNAGSTATNAANSVFVGRNAGWQATNAASSVFIGFQAGGSDGNNPTPGAVNASNAIFIGQRAGFKDSVNTTGAADDFSILIGKSTSTGGFANSIAIGGSATNTASNQFMIGSTTRPIDTTRINGSASTQCTITTGTGIACTSDERLKTDIVDLSSSTLETLLAVRTVSYRWSQDPDSPQQVGFLAQDLEQYFPQLVATDSTGYKSVYYAQMTPILVEAIREINKKIVDINDLTIENNWRDSITAWFANAGNRITRIFTGEICLTDPDGTSECINKQQLGQLKQLLYSSALPVRPIQIPDPLGESTPESHDEPTAETIDEQSDTEITTPESEEQTPPAPVEETTE